MRSRRAVIARLSVFVAFLIAAVMVALLVPAASLDNVRASVTGTGPVGLIGFMVAYALITLTPAPKSILTIIAGGIWGFPTGFLPVYGGTLIGASLAFLVGRHLGREAVERFTGARVERLNAAITRRGFLSLLTLRLIPVFPFTAVNYAASLTNVRRRDYALATALGVIPGDLIAVAIGAFGSDWSPATWAGIAGAAALLGLAGLLVSRAIRHRRIERLGTVGQEHEGDA